jgi:hypothetical protein
MCIDNDEIQLDFETLFDLSRGILEFRIAISSAKSHNYMYISYDTQPASTCFRAGDWASRAYVYG